MHRHAISYILYEEYRRERGKEHTRRNESLGTWDTPYVVYIYRQTVEQANETETEKCTHRVCGVYNIYICTMKVADSVELIGNGFKINEKLKRLSVRLLDVWLIRFALRLALIQTHKYERMP